jgi:predicted RND superfamily exporter protein
MFAAMGWGGVPLGVATSMFAATVLCIGDDYAIHLAEATRRARRAGRGFRDAVVEAVATTAPAVLLDAVAVGAAFGVLCFSRVPPNARLGGLLVVSILVCLVTTLAALPALLGWLGPRVMERAGDEQV